MVQIILNKLSSQTVTSIGGSSATVYDFLEVFLSAINDFHTFLPHLNIKRRRRYRSGASINVAPTSNSSGQIRIPAHFLRDLEMGLCSVDVAKFRPACVALAVLRLHCTESEVITNPSKCVQAEHEEPRIRLIDLYSLANLCQVTWPDVEDCAFAIKSSKGASAVKSSSECPCLNSSSQMVWNLSRKTQRNLRISRTRRVRLLPIAEESTNDSVICEDDTESMLSAVDNLRPIDTGIRHKSPSSFLPPEAFIVAPLSNISIACLSQNAELLNHSPADQKYYQNQSCVQSIDNFRCYNKATSPKPPQ
ncbi:unnamed protein product [Protopolystoma xenopodis]|uniref:Uncharacterized protein n=1 Tax=Protopolystoma xenopodis TaxID=117903 RepID=A0A3S5FFH1_9PLAT|nr:unnamed protein product [Protopolystoma xenopodis]